jgi:23S rRNA G2069 N7-methylase RlmK/C1962 C5-methylase RlmI
VVRFLNRTARTDTKYDLIVSDPPPRFSRGSDWAYEAELHTGRGLHSYTSELNLSNCRTHR